MGDAAGFIDPFTGEGIYLSLRSAQLAMATIDSSFKNLNFSKNKLAEYDLARTKEFGEKFVLSRIIQKVIYSRKLCDFLVTALSKNPSVANDIVGVIGDYYPAKKVVSLKFLLKFIQGILLSK